MNAVEFIEHEKVVVVLRIREHDVLYNAVEALVAGGLTCFEVTGTVPSFDMAIMELRNRYGDAVLIGAGTVLDAQNAKRAVDAGAEFLVSPARVDEVWNYCRSAEVPYIPGCFTPTEIFSAWNNDAPMVKVFPARSLGPAFIKDVKAPMPDLRLMPTGGVTPDSAREWLRNGATAVAIGSELLQPGLIQSGDFASLTVLAQELRTSIMQGN